MKSATLLVIISFLFAGAFALQKSECRCRASAVSRIVGGQQSDQTYPWFVTIRKYNATEEENTNLTDLQKKLKLRCGGVVINNLWVLTTAECLFYQELHGGDYVVQYGSNNLGRLLDTMT